jgi:hypothetical protein
MYMTFSAATAALTETETDALLCGISTTSWLKTRHCQICPNLIVIGFVQKELKRPSKIIQLSLINPREAPSACSLQWQLQLPLQLLLQPWCEEILRHTE